MALSITDRCVNCYACQDVCPTLSPRVQQSFISTREPAPNAPATMPILNVPVSVLLSRYCSTVKGMKFILKDP